VTPCKCNKDFNVYLIRRHGLIKSSPKLKRGVKIAYTKLRMGVKKAMPKRGKADAGQFLSEIAGRVLTR
jgi:hypothetical protein